MNEMQEDTIAERVRKIRTVIACAQMGFILSAVFSAALWLVGGPVPQTLTGWMGWLLIGWVVASSWMAVLSRWGGDL